MRYDQVDVGPQAQHTEGEPACCNRAEQVWMMDELLIAAWDRRPLLTDALDALPPWRARMTAGPLLRAGATLQHGTPEQFEQAAVAAGRSGNHEPGWWRAALGMPPREQPPRSPRNTGPYVPPPGWKVVKPADN